MRATHLFIAITAVMLSNAALAVEIKSTLRDDAVLAKGSRLVAGEPGKNEFFILGSNDDMPVMSEEARPVKTVTLKQIDTGSKKRIAPLHMAMKQTRPASISKPHLTNTRLAFHTARPQARKHQLSLAIASRHAKATPALLASRKNLAKIRLALHQSAHKSHAHVFVKTAMKHHAAKSRYAQADRKSLAKIRMALDQAIHKARSQQAIKTVMVHDYKIHSAQAGRKRHSKIKVSATHLPRTVRLTPTIIHI